MRRWKESTEEKKGNKKRRRKKGGRNKKGDKNINRVEGRKKER